jgi:hypothetical protein
MKKKILLGLSATVILLIGVAILFPVFASAKVNVNRNNPALKARANQIDLLFDTVSQQVSHQDWDAAEATSHRLKLLTSPSTEHQFTQGTILIGQGRAKEGLRLQERAAWVGDRPYWHSPYVFIQLARSAKETGIPDLADRAYRQSALLLDENPAIVPADQAKRLRREASQAR